MHFNPLWIGEEIVAGMITMYAQVIHNPAKDFLVPIIFIMDKMVISEVSYLNVYVILFITSIFNGVVCVGGQM